MPRIAALLATTLCALVAPALSSYAPLASAQDVVEASSFKVGDRLVYRRAETLRGDEELERIEQVVTAQDGPVLTIATTVLANPKNPDRVGRKGRFRFDLRRGVSPTESIVDDERKFWNFPMSVGKTWSHGYTLKRSDGGTDVSKIESKATEWTSLTIGDKTYRALKLEHVQNIAANASSGVRRNFSAVWYTTHYFIPELGVNGRTEFSERDGSAKEISRTVTTLVEVTKAN